MVEAGRKLIVSGQGETAARMAAAGMQVVGSLLEKLQGEKQQVAALCGAALQVVGLAALGQRQQALEGARQLDAATGGGLGMAERVEGVGEG